MCPSLSPSDARPGRLYGGTYPCKRLYGFVNMDALKEMLDESVLLASVMAVNNEIGTIQDVPTIAGALAEWGILFHCDAAQAPCAMDLTQDCRIRRPAKPVGTQVLRTTGSRISLRPKIPSVRYGTGHLRRWSAVRSKVRNHASGTMCWHGRGCRTRSWKGAPTSGRGSATLRDQFVSHLQEAGAKITDQRTCWMPGGTRATRICASTGTRPTTFSGQSSQS